MTSELTYEPNELIIKGKEWRYLPTALICSFGLLWLIVGPYESTRIIFKENLFFAVALVLLTIIACLYSWVKFLDRSIKIVVNRNGIWAKKHGLIPWQSIHYYYFGVDKETEYSPPLLCIKTRSLEDEVKIEISYFKHGQENLSNAIQHFSKKYEIHNLSDDQYN